MYFLSRPYGASFLKISPYSRPLRGSWNFFSGPHAGSASKSPSVFSSISGVVSETHPISRFHMTRFPKTPYCPCHVGSGSLSPPICAHIWCYFSTDLALLTHALISGTLRAINALSFYTALCIFWRKSEDHQMYNRVFFTFFSVAGEKH